MAKSLVEFPLLELPGVVGVGIGMREEEGELFDELAVVIYAQDAAQLPGGFPEEVRGVAVCIVGRQIEPLALPDAARYPDVRGGITPPLLASGTLGAVVEDVRK